ncbi:MAG: GntR family transcriptional regulator [Enterocloster sp.]
MRHLKQEILDLRLEPGRMISENDICERFGVSRNTGA